MLKHQFNYLVPFALGSALIFAGCSDKSATKKEIDTDTIVSKYVNYSDEDFYTDWQSKSFTKIQLNKTSAKADGAGGVVIEGQQISIKTSGVYVLEGTLNDGQIIIDIEDKGEVRLILDGVNIQSTKSAPIYVKQSDKTVISLEEGTENIVTDAKEYVYEDKSSDEPSATIFSKDDLTINGTGSLVVNGNYNDGIAGRDNLLITGGNIQVTAADDGIVGRDVLAMRDASVTVEAAGDGIKSSNDEDDNKGNIVLESGSLNITAGSDGISSEKAIAVIDGEYHIVAGGGSPETITSTEDFGMGGPGMGQGGQMPPSGTAEGATGQAGTPPEMPQDGQGTPPEIPQGEQAAPPEAATSSGTQNAQQGDATANPSTEETADSDDTVSTKGVKAGNNLEIYGGTFNIDSLEDALHSNEDLSIVNGTFTMSTGDDGIHADADVSIAGGTIDIKKSYEGIEGINVTISDGSIHLIAADDGVNINGGSSEMGMPGGFGPGMTQSTTEESSEEVVAEESTEEESLLLIKGGYLYVDADGDGLDSNTDMKMTGGTVIVYGPINDGNGPLDYDGEFIVEGGTLVAAGSSGMALGISDNSSQNAIMMTYDEMQEAATSIYVENSDGKQVFAITPEKTYQSIVISTPDLKKDETYTLNTGGILKGKKVDGVYEKATYKEGTQSVEFKLSTVMTYLNKDGITEKQEGMMGGPMGGGQMPVRGGRPNTNSSDTNTDTNQ